jgi:hypothetical protein
VGLAWEVKEDRLVNSDRKGCFEIDFGVAKVDELLHEAAAEVVEAGWLEQQQGSALPKSLKELDGGPCVRGFDDGEVSRVDELVLKLHGFSLQLEHNLVSTLRIAQHDWFLLLHPIPELKFGAQKHLQQQTAMFDQAFAVSHGRH